MLTELPMITLALRFGVLLIWLSSVRCPAFGDDQFQIVAVTNSADFKEGLPQKGSLASIFMTGLQGPPGIVVNTQDPLLNAPVLGVGVWINFMPAPILAIAFQNGYQQINIQIPWEGARDPLYVEVFQGSNRARLESAYTNNGFHPATGWSVFLTDPSGHANLRHASDYSLVTQNNPAHAGEDVIAYGINLGPVKNTPRSGYHAPDLSAAFDPSAIGIEVCAGYDTIMIGNTPVQPTYDGLAAGLTGVYQVNFRVPPGLSGELPLAIQRTLVVFPLGACRPDQQHINETTASASALLSVR